MFLLDWSKGDLPFAKVWLDGVEIHHVLSVDPDSVHVVRSVRDEHNRLITTVLGLESLKETIAGQYVAVYFDDGREEFGYVKNQPADYRSPSSVVNLFTGKAVEITAVKVPPKAPTKLPELLPAAKPEPPKLTRKRRMILD